MTHGWIEIKTGRAMGRTFPWLAKVKRLPGGGVITQCGLWQHNAANDTQSS